MCSKGRKSLNLDYKDLQRSFGFCTIQRNSLKVAFQAKDRIATDR